MPELPLDQAVAAAVAHHRAGNLAQAESIYRQVLAVDANHADALNLLGALLLQSGEFVQALEFMRRSVARNPESAVYRCNLCTLLNSMGQVEESIRMLKQLVVERPSFPQAWLNLADAHAMSGDYQSAMAAYTRTFQQAPNDAVAHRNYSYLLLLHGNFQDGLPEYEWRLKVPEDLASQPAFPMPKWIGQELAGKRILIYPEQGYGDAIQFVRYVPLVHARGGRVLLHSAPKLTRLFSSVPEIEHVLIARREEIPPGIDFECSLLSLPLAFNTTLETIPDQVPYLRPELEKVEHFRSRFVGTERKLKVGIVWAGSRRFANDRSLPPDELMPLTKLVDRVQFVSLHVGSKSADPPKQLNLLDWSSELDDFADTAALIQTLDLVISVDTAVAHLAGALGRPTWVVLTHDPDWRWLLNRSDSPWYPTMRLFRQPRRGDWSTVIEQVVAALMQLAV